VLDEVPGFETAHESANSNPSSPGNQSLPNIRGSLTQETLAQIDGHNVARSNVAGYRLQYLNSALYQAVEVVKGPGVTVNNINYDIMGAVNFRSLDPTSQPHGYIDYSTDNFGGQAADLSLTGTTSNGRLGYALVYSLFGAHGPAQNVPVDFDIQQYSQVGGDYVMSGTVTPTAVVKGGTPNPPQFPNTTLYTKLPVSSYLNERAELAKIRYRLSSATTVTASYFGTHGQTDENGNHFWQDPAVFNPNTVAGAPASATYPTGGAFGDVPAGTNLFMDDNYVPPYQVRKQDEPVYELDLRTSIKNDSILARYFATATNNHATNGVLNPACPINQAGCLPSLYSWTVNGPVYGSFQSCVLPSGSSIQTTNAASCTTAGGVVTNENFNGQNVPVSLGTIPGQSYACDNGAGFGGGKRYTFTPIYPGAGSATNAPLTCSPASPNYVGTVGVRNGGTGTVGDGYFASNSVDKLQGGSFEYDHTAGPNTYTLALESNKTNSQATNSSYVDDANGTSEWPGTNNAIEGAMLRGILHLSRKVDATVAGYFNKYFYHVTPDNGATWNDISLTHTDERVGITYRPSSAASIRFAFGSSIAPAFTSAYVNSIAVQGAANNFAACGAGVGATCTLTVTNPNLLPETAFGYDLGGSFHVIDTATVLDVDTYYEVACPNLTLCPSPGVVGEPLFVTEVENVSNARYKGIEVSLHRDPAVGFGYVAQGNLQQGCPYNLPASIYGNNFSANLAAVPCGVSNYIPPGDGTGVNADKVTGIARNNTPYAGGYGELSYHTPNGGLIAFGEEYYGNNNTYNIAPFFKANATLAFPVYGRSNRLTFTAENIFNADDNPFVSQELGIPEPLANQTLGLTNAFGIGPAKYTIDFKHNFGSH
jgi:hypothetical protein